jgi:hypothetical protein
VTAAPLRSLLLVLLLPGLVASTALASGLDVEGGRVRWDDGLESLGRQAARALPAVREEVGRRLGWPYAGPDVEVVVVSGLDRMQEEAHAAIPEWAVGVALSSRALILIRADLLHRGFGSGVVPVLRHEWVHLAWGHRAGVNRRLLPLWAEEGLAEDIGGGVSIDLGSTLDLAVVFDRLLDFRGLEERFPRSPARAALAYRQSESWIQYVAERAGWPPLQAVLAELAAGEASGAAFPEESPFEQAVRIQTGRSVGEWQAGWRVALEERATPWFHLLLRDFQGTLLLALALVGAVAFFFVVRRRRRQIARLPDS